MTVFDGSASCQLESAGDTASTLWLPFRPGCSPVFVRGSHSGQYYRLPPGPGGGGAVSLLCSSDACDADTCAIRQVQEEKKTGMSMLKNGNRIAG